jgi:hypothetical protein
VIRQLLTGLPYRDFFEPPFFEDERLVDEVLLEAAAARFVEPPFLAEDRDADFVPPRADERAEDFDDERALDFDPVFLAAVRLVADLVPLFFAPVFLAAVFLAPDFLAADFVPLFFAADLVPDFFAADFVPLFLAAVFLAPDFFAAVFFAPDFVPLFLAADFFAPDFFAAVFFAPDLLLDFLLLFEPLRELLFFAEPVVDPLDVPALVPMSSIGFDLSSVGIAASFKGLRATPSRLFKATSLYQASSEYRTVLKVEDTFLLWIFLRCHPSRLARRGAKSLPRDSAKVLAHVVATCMLIVTQT